MNRERLIERLERIVGRGSVLHRPGDILVYEYDGSVDGVVDTAAPAAVVLPTTMDQIAAVVRLAKEAGLPVVARGAGTGLSGGAVAQRGGIIVSMARMNRILDIDHEDRTALVEPGVVTSSCRRRRSRMATSLPRTRQASAPAPSAATSPRTPAAPTASSTGSRPTMSWGWKWYCPMGGWFGWVIARAALPATI